MIKILILGGGFGGIRCALDLEKKLTHSKDSGQENKAEITLVDKNGYHLFIPDLYEVASAYGLKKDLFAVQLRRSICMPYADIFDNRHINFIQAEITSIDLVGQKIKTAGNHTLDFDYLVLALGNNVADFDIPGVKEYAHQFKSLRDALFINKKLEEFSEQFIKQQRTDPFSLLICGGGFTGIELAAELGCCSKVIKERCRLKGRCSAIILFEAGPKILPTISEHERKIIKERLTKLGIIIMENSPIEEVQSSQVKLKNGLKIDGDLIIWTAGTQPHQLLRMTEGIKFNPAGKIMTKEDLRIVGLKNVFGIGDSIEFVDPRNQRPVPAQAYTAIDQGRIAATNIIRLINNKKTKPYKPFYDIWIIPVGGKFALAHLWKGWLIKGFWGWVVRQLVDIRYLLSLFSLQKALEIYWNEVTIFSKND